MSDKQQARKFNYAVGFYWPDGNGSVGVYNYFGEVHYGTIEDARDSRTYCQNQSDNKGKDKREYKIFQLVEIPE